MEEDPDSPTDKNRINTVKHPSITKKEFPRKSLPDCAFLCFNKNLANQRNLLPKEFAYLRI